MLDRTLGFLLAQLNDHLGTRYPSKEPHVVVSSLSTMEGTVPPEIANRVVLTLVNVEREGAAGPAPGPIRTENGTFVRTSPPLNVNLYVLVSASFGSNYAEALKLLSAVLGYFQGKPAFNAQSAPTFPKGLERLTMEIVNLDVQGVNNLWGNLGVKYLPSVLYKARMFTMQEAWVTEQVPPISGIDVV
jgi:hypothetical protein